MENQDVALEACIKLCWACRHDCQKTLFRHCLEEGGAHAAPDHVKLMTDCMEICQTAADFMTRESSMHTATCRACAEICEACARSCERIGDSHMNACAEICRQCAASCREMSDTRKAA